MRCYVVKGPGCKRYAATQAGIKAERDKVMSITGCNKKEITSREVDVPTNKAELLSFINDLCKEADAK